MGLLKKITCALTVYTSCKHFQRFITSLPVIKKEVIFLNLLVCMNMYITSISTKTCNYVIFNIRMIITPSHQCIEGAKHSILMLIILDIINMLNVKV